MASWIAAAPATKQLYVEWFTTKAGSENLQRELISELRKLKSISLVSTAADAAYVVDGGGEIWVKGYKSLNPRSGRLPSEGEPVYAGYLSVELRDSRGQTFWSDLVTPGNESANVSRDLARRIAKDVMSALDAGEPPSNIKPLPQPEMILHGAGATFPNPVYAKWFKNYRRDNPSLEIVMTQSDRRLEFAACSPAVSTSAHRIIRKPFVRLLPRSRISICCFLLWWER